MRQTIGYYARTSLAGHTPNRELEHDVGCREMEIRVMWHSNNHRRGLSCQLQTLGEDLAGIGTETNTMGSRRFCDWPCMRTGSSVLPVLAFVYFRLKRKHLWVYLLSISARCCPSLTLMLDPCELKQGFRYHHSAQIVYPTLVPSVWRTAAAAGFVITRGLVSTRTT